MTTIGPKMPLLGFSEPPLGLLRNVSWAAQENVMLELPDRSRRAAALPGPQQDVSGAQTHPSCGMTAAQIGMI